MISGVWKGRLQGWLLRVLRHAEDALEAARRLLVPAPVTLFRDVTAPWLASALCLAARLRLADHLGGERLPVDELARRARVGSKDLARLLDVLRAHGYFRVTLDGVVSATPLSRALGHDVAGSFAELQGRGWYRKAFHSGWVMAGWEQGRTPFEVATGEHFFDFLAQRPSDRDLFSAAMADVTRFCVPYLAVELELTPGSAVLDVGGGDGELARALARLHPTCRLAVLDRARTDSSVSSATENYTFHEGDFFAEMPAGYSHLCLKNILHDWDDERCLALLRSCRRGVSAGARLSVIECLLPEPGASTHGKAMTFALDWNVWLTLSGRERSASDYGALLRQTGWKLTEAKPTATPYGLLEAVAV